MTGTITIFDNRKASGVISAEDGLRVRFDSAAVLAYDVTALAVGQSVTFEVARGTDPKASNVCVERPHLKRPGPVTRDNAPPRYMGFEQSGNTRRYRYEQSLTGDSRTFTVNVDMALFTRHHVGIQEGPTLCLRLLTDSLDGIGVDVAAPPALALGDREMIVYLESRPVKGPRNRITTPVPMPA